MLPLTGWCDQVENLRPNMTSAADTHTKVEIGPTNLVVTGDSGERKKEWGMGEKER